MTRLNQYKIFTGWTATFTEGTIHFSMIRCKANTNLILITSDQNCLFLCYGLTGSHRYLFCSFSLVFFSSHFFTVFLIFYFFLFRKNIFSEYCWSYLRHKISYDVNWNSFLKLTQRQTISRKNSFCFYIQGIWKREHSQKYSPVERLKQHDMKNSHP